MNNLKTFFIVIAFLSFYSCEDEKNLVGPCEHTYNEPILNITSIRDTINNKYPTFVILRELKINGNPQSIPLILSNSYSVVANDSVYYCNVPFGFGVEDGTYQFIIEAEGFQPKLINIENVNYSIFKGGCPSYNDGGKRVEININ